MRDFPHLNDTDYPYLNNQDAYTFRNEFDYSQWGAGLKIRFYNVPWNNTDQAVQFESDTARDAWFDDNASKIVEIATAAEQVPTDYIDVPLPYMTAAGFNYVELVYQIQPNPAHPLDYAVAGGIYRYHYFITSCEQLAPSTTRLKIARDLWTTYVNRLDVAYLMLERGHAPMFSTNVGKYLENPQANASDLLAPDVNFGTPDIVTASDSAVFNPADGTLAVICSSADLTGNATDNVPALPLYVRQGAPSSFACALPAASLDGFLTALASQLPHLMQTIEAVLFIGSDYVNLGTAFTLAGYTLNRVEGKETSIDILDLNPESFAYPERYAQIAKLYTYPYAVIEITNGEQTHEIRIEETSGTVSAQALTSLAFPKAGLEVVLSGIAGTASRSIAFQNAGNRSVTLAGKWYDRSIRYDIPTYGVRISAATEYDYSTRYDRAQASLSAHNAYNSAVASANTGKTNADASAETSVTNTANSGSAQTSNTNIATAASATTVARNNKASTQLTAIGNSTSQAAQAYDAGLQRGVQEVDAESQSATTAANAVGNAAGSIVSGAMSGGIAGAIGGLVSSAISGVTAGVTNAILLNAASAKVELTITNSQNKVTSQNASNEGMTSETNNAQTDNVTTGNNAQKSQTKNLVDAANTNAANSASTAKGNASRTQTTSIANAERSRSTALSAIDNNIKQAALRAPSAFGADTGNDKAVTMPMIFAANVVTQQPSAIAQAGEQFLRFGYALNKPWSTDKLALREGFTYWQASDAIIRPASAATSAISDAADDVRARLIAGVTVWSSPEAMEAL